MKNDTQNEEELEIQAPELEAAVEEASVDDIEFEDGEADFKSKLKSIKEKLVQSLKEKQEYLDGWQRERAEFANYKKDEDSRKSRVSEMAREKLIMELLSVLDSFDMAFANKEAWEKADKNWRVGVEYIYTQFLTILEGYNVKQIGDVGVPFDPNIHQSIETVSTDEKEKDHNIEKVIQKGYQIGDRTLRPARVNVFEFKEN